MRRPETVREVQAAAPQGPSAGRPALRRLLSALALAAGVAALVGCGARMGVAPVRGMLYTRYRAPMFLRSEEPGGVARPANLKVGTATAWNLVAPRTSDTLSGGWGDVSLVAAARNGGITKISYADYEMLSILGIYNRATVYAYGE